MSTSISITKIQLCRDRGESDSDSQTRGSQPNFQGFHGLETRILSNVKIKEVNSARIADSEC